MTPTRILMGCLLALGAVLPFACTREPSPESEQQQFDTVAEREVFRAAAADGRGDPAAVRIGSLVYISAQTGRDPQTGEIPEGIDAQTELAMANMRRVLADAGLTPAHLVKCHVYLARMDDYAGMNAAYGRAFEGRVPARTTVQAVQLPASAGVQISCFAHRDLQLISVVQVPDGALPRPLGPYSPAVWAGSTLYLSGMGGQFPADRRLPDTLAAQVDQTLASIRTTLEAADLSLGDVVLWHAYVTAPDELRDLAPALARTFAPSTLPPGGVTVLDRLPGDIKVELTMVAERPTSGRAMFRDERALVPARGVRSGETVYTRTEEAPEAGPDLEAQWRTVIARLMDTLSDGDFGSNDVAYLQVGVSDDGDLARIDALLRDAFPDGPPASTVLQVHAPDNVRVQVSAIAAR